MKRLVLLVLLLGCAAPDALDVPSRLPSSFESGVAPPPRERPEVAPLLEKLKTKIGEGDLVELALALNPDLDIQRQETRAARARLHQAGLYVYNPELYVGFDSYHVGHESKGGEDPFRMQYGVQQQIEFPTKRGHRMDAAEAVVRGADADFESRSRDVRTAVRSALVDILVAQERLEVVKKTHEIARRLHEVASARVSAETSPPIEETKADAAELKALNAVRADERDLEAARAELAGVLGNPGLVMGALEGALAIDGPDLTFEGTKPIDAHPSLIAKGHALDGALANLEVQRAAAWPDPTILFAYNRVQGDTDLLTGNVLIPLPILNANQGAIRDAALAIEKARSDLDSTRATLATRYRQAIATYGTARANAKLLREKTLPAVEKALGLAEEGWKAGKLRYLDVLDAENTWAGIRDAYVVALQDLNHAIIQIEGLTGKRVDELGR
jgi:cobalt-zinc-cadmium efflux system outer membrane protein